MHLKHYLREISRLILADKGKRIFREGESFVKPYLSDKLRSFPFCYQYIVHKHDFIFVCHSMEL